MQVRLGEARRSSREPVSRNRARLVTAVRAAALVVVLCLTQAGCLGRDSEAIFSGRDSASALLVQWADDGNGRLSGSIQLADKAVTADGVPVKQTTLVFNGTLESDQVSLVVTGDPSSAQAQTQTWSGQLDDDELRINVPEGGKSVDTITLTRGSADQYNAYVSALGTAVVKARTEAARAAAESRRQATNAAAATRNRELFDNAVTGLSIARETVAALMLDPPELKALPEDLDGGGQNLALVKQNVGEAAQRSRGFVACEFAQQALGAADDVASDAAFLDDDVRAVKQAADDLADGRDELSRAYLALQQISDREGPSPKSAAPELRTLVDRARATAAGWRTAAKKADKKMKSLVSQANNLANNARRASC